MSSRILPPGIPRAMLWTGIAASAALSILLLVTRIEALPGQVADAPAALLLVLALLVGILLSRWEGCGRFLDAMVRPRNLLLVSLAALVILAAGSYLVFGTVPLSTDEQTNLFQARLFAQFKITASYPPELISRIIPAGYQNFDILVAPDGRAMAVTWPGWALLMTPFVWIGAPWLLGPVMASLGLYVLGRLAALFANAQAAAVAVLLAVTSGSFVVTGMSIYPSGGFLTLNLLYAWLLLTGGRRNALLAGLVGGLALNLANPVPHALFALPWVAWLALDRGRRSRLFWMAIGYSPWLVVSVLWLLATSSLHAGTSGSAGNFWLDRLPAFVSIPTLYIVGERFWELVRLWVWSAPGLLVLAVVAWRRQPRMSGAWILGVAFGLTVLLYVLFPVDQGLGWGARYYQGAWGALPILAGILLVGPGADELRRIAVAAALAGLVLVVPLEVAYAYQTTQAARVDDSSLGALAAQGGDVCFIDYQITDRATLPFADDQSLRGRLVFISFGPASDQALVDSWFPGARLVTSTSSGSCYLRP